MGAVAGKTPDSPDKKAPGMRRGGTQQAEDWAVRRVNDVVADDLKWFFRAEPLFDYGVDAQAELVADDAVRAENRIHGSDQQKLLSRRLARDDH